MAGTFTINSKAEKTTLVATDEGLIQETAGGVLKKFLMSSLQSYLHPVGEVYIQYYGKSLPATIYGGTWAKIYDNDAVSIMTEGSYDTTHEAELFDGVIRDSQMQGHYHSGVLIASASMKGINTNASAGSSPIWGLNTGSTEIITIQSPVTDGPNGTPRIGKATKPRRVIVRIWERIA